MCVLAAAGADPELIALDVLAQAEHGPGTLALAVSDDGTLLDAVGAQSRRPGRGGADRARRRAGHRGRAELRRGARARAPRAGRRRRRGPGSARAPRGCLFVGAAGATAFGDYVAGSNHTLPTGGSARFASGLGPRHFRRRMSEVRIGSAAAALAPAGAAIARAEGFDVHAASMEVRENPRP